MRPLETEVPPSRPTTCFSSTQGAAEALPIWCEITGGVARRKVTESTSHLFRRRRPEGVWRRGGHTRTEGAASPCHPSAAVFRILRKGGHGPLFTHATRLGLVSIPKQKIEGRVSWAVLSRPVCSKGRSTVGHACSRGNSSPLPLAVPFTQLCPSHLFISLRIISNPPHTLPATH